MQFYLQSAVAEKGIGEDELRLSGRRDRRRDLDQRDRGVHRRGRRHDPRGGRQRHLRRPTRRSPSSPSPGELATACSRSACSGVGLAATIMPISTAFVICEAFGWESRRRQAVPRRAGVLRDLHVRARVRRPVVLLPGLDPIPADHREPVPPGPAAADRARVHRPARQRRAAHGPPPQRPRAQRARVDRPIGRADRGTRPRAAGHGRARASA